LREKVRIREIKNRPPLSSTAKAEEEKVVSNLTRIKADPSLNVQDDL
jgi:hypothetical protein